MPRLDRRDPLLEQRWRRLLGEWARSRLTVRAFCRQQRVSEANFYAWRREIAQRDRERSASPDTAALLPVRLLACEPLEIVLPSGPVLRVPATHDPAVVARLVAALEGRS